MNSAATSQACVLQGEGTDARPPGPFAAPPVLGLPRGSPCRLAGLGNAGIGPGSVSGQTRQRRVLTASPSSLRPPLHGDTHQGHVCGHVSHSRGLRSWAVFPCA